MAVTWACFCCKASPPAAPPSWGHLWPVQWQGILGLKTLNMSTKQSLNPIQFVEETCSSIINALCFHSTMDFQRIPGLCQLLRTVRGLGSHQCPWCSAMPYDSSRISRLNTLFITCICRFRYIQTSMIFKVLISLDFPGRNAALYHVNLQVSLWLFWNPLFMLCLANWYRTEDVWAIQWKGHQGRDAGTGGESQSAKVIFWSWPKRDLIWFRYTWVWWQESRHLGHNYVGTEMLLVGVVADTSGASGKVLKKFNVTLKDRRVDYSSDVKRDWKEHEKQCH